jgi:hypothetical protein
LNFLLFYVIQLKLKKAIGEGGWVEGKKVRVDFFKKEEAMSRAALGVTLTP